MIGKILELLDAGEYLGESKYIDFAKGEYSIAKNRKEKANQVKRVKAWR